MGKRYRKIGKRTAILSRSKAHFSIVLAVLFIFGATLKCDAQLDTIFLKPNILLEYNYSPWKGPGIRYFNAEIQKNHWNRIEWGYNYPGGAGIARIERNSLYKDIEITSGYLNQIHKLNQSYVYDGYHSWQKLPRYQNTEILADTLIQIHGYIYHFQTIEYPVDTYGKKQKMIKITFAELDTIFSDNTFLHIYTRTNGSVKFLEKRLNRLVRISKVDPVFMDQIHNRNFNPENFKKANEISYNQWEEIFNANYAKQLNCSDAESIRAMSAYVLETDEIVALMSQFNYDQIADTIRKIHRQILDNTTAAFFDYKNRFGYSVKREYDFYQKINNGKTEVSDYLNYMNGDSTFTFLDTLDAFNTIRDFMGAIYSYSDYDNYDEIKSANAILKRRFQSDVESTMCDQFALQFLPYDRSQQMRYRKVSDTGNRKIYLFAIDDYGFDTPYMVIFEKTETAHWNHTTLPLNFRPFVDGRTDVSAWGDYLVISGLENYVVIDKRNSATTPQTFSLDQNLYNKFAEIYIIKEPMLNEPNHFGLMNHIPNQPLTYTIEEFSIHKRRSPEEIAYRQSFTLKDLNNDGVDEFFTYDVSNGQLLSLQCSTLIDGNLTWVDSSEAASWLMNDEQFTNILAYSQLGNHRKQTLLPSKP